MMRMTSAQILTYCVRKGDQLSKIARRFRVPLSQLYRLNRLSSSSTLRVGRFSSLSPSRPGRRDVPPIIAAKTTEVSPPETLKRHPYIVKQGDTPFSIAKRNGIAMNDLLAWNKIDEKQPVIHCGGTLKVANGSAGLALQDSSKPAPIDLARKDSSTATIPQSRQDSSSAIGSATNPTAAKDSSIAVLVQNVDSSTDWDNKISDSAVPVTAISNADDSEKTVPPAPLYYTIKKGDNLFRISLKFSVPLPVLLTANNLPGKPSCIPAIRYVFPTPQGPVFQKGRTAFLNKKSYITKSDSATPYGGLQTAFGVSVEEIYKQNKIKSDSVLVPGRVIKVIKAGVNVKKMQKWLIANRSCTAGALSVS